MAYRDEFKRYENEAYWTIPRVALYLFVVIALGFVLTFVFWPARIAERATDPDKVISNYEEFQEIYNTTQKLNQDLCNLRETPEADPMFQKGFSKSERINAIRQNMNRWIEEYNAKSRMITRSAWKSGSLPYQLSTSDFSCY